MKKICKAVTMILGLIACFMLCGFSEAKAANGPCEGDNSYAYIEIGQDVIGKTESGEDRYCTHYVYMSDFLKKNHDEYPEYYTYDVIENKNVKYNKKTNTLTLNNFSSEGITVNMMGDDFKIELIGENNLEKLYVYTDYYGNNLTLTGKGTLNISGGDFDVAHVQGATGLRVFCESDDAKTILTVDKNVTLHVEGNGTYSYPLIAVYQTNEKKNGIVLNGVKLKGSYIAKSEVMLPDSEDGFGVCIKDGKEYYYKSNYEYNWETFETTQTVNVYKKDSKKTLVESFGDLDSFYKAGYKDKEKTAYTYAICGKECTISAKVDTTPVKGDVIEAGSLCFGILTAGTKKKAGTVCCAGLKNWNEAPKSIKIPNTLKVNGITYKVTAVCDEAFMANYGIETLIIGANVKTIGKNAFSDIGSLKEIIINTKKLKASTVKKDALKLYSDNITVQVPSGKAASYKKILQARGLNVKATIK